MKYLLIALALTACTAQAADEAIPVSSIYWSDGDSGRINGMKFRLADIDAPETGGVGAAIGGAKCEAERALGYDAKAFMIELTRNAALLITEDHGTDRYERTVIVLEADGRDVAAAGVASGHLRPWPHRGQRSLTKKPDWCA